MSKTDRSGPDVRDIQKNRMDPERFRKDPERSGFFFFSGSPAFHAGLHAEDDETFFYPGR